MTSTKDGLIPHAKHGAKTVRSLAVCGSKLDGTGFEKLQIGHIQVPLLLGGAAGVGRWNGLSDREGDEVELLERPLRFDTARLCMIEERLRGLGIRVILAEDFKKPAWPRQTYPLPHNLREDIRRTRTSPHPSGLLRWSSFEDPRCRHSKYGVRSDRPGHFDGLGS